METEQTADEKEREEKSKNDENYEQQLNSDKLNN